MFWFYFILRNPNLLIVTRTPRRGRPVTVLENCSAPPRPLWLPSRPSQQPRCRRRLPTCRAGHAVPTCHHVARSGPTATLSASPMVCIIPWPSHTHALHSPIHAVMAWKPRGVRASPPLFSLAHPPMMPFCNLVPPGIIVAAMECVPEAMPEHWWSEDCRRRISLLSVAAEDRTVKTSVDRQVVTLKVSASLSFQSTLLFSDWC